MDRRQQGKESKGGSSSSQSSSTEQKVSTHTPLLKSSSKPIEGSSSNVEENPLEMVTEDQNQRRTAGQKLSDFCQHLLSCCGVLPCRESEELETVYCQQSTSAQAPSLSPPSEIPLHRPRKASFSLPIGESFYPQSTRRTGGNGEVKVLPELNEQISNLQQLHDFLKKFGSESCLQSHILFEFCKRVARTSRNTGDGFTLFVHPIKVEEISSLGSMNVNPTLITKYVEDSQVVDPIQCASYLKLTSSSTNAEFVAAESELSNLLLTKLECRPTFEAISLNPVFIKEGPPPERLFASVLELKYDHQEYLRFCNAKAKSMGIKVLDIRIFSEEVPSQPPLQRLQNKTKMCTRIVETIQASLPLLQKLDDEEESHYVIFDVHLNVCPYWLTQITVSSVCSDGVSPESCPAIRDSRAEIKRLEHFGDNLIEWQSPTKVLKAEVCNKIIARYLKFMRALYQIWQK